METAMIDFSDLDQKDFTGHVAAPRAVQTFPCQSCAGTGQYHRHNRFESTICFACNGKGSHKKPHADTMRDKQVRKAKLAATQIRKVEAARDALPAGVFAFLAKNSDWSDFFRSLYDQVNGGKCLSENQIGAILRSQAKMAAKREEKQAARTTDVDLAAIEALFDKAKESGLKKLVYRAHGLVLSPAKAASANFGSIYVKTKGGEYLGKVTGNRFICTSAATDEHKATLNAVAADPSGEAKAYGKATGECCCCGRELTDPASISNGIGPICASNWGL
jgi:hypothetical protein